MSRGRRGREVSDLDFSPPTSSEPRLVLISRRMCGDRCHGGPKTLKEAAVEEGWLDPWRERGGGLVEPP